MDFVKIYDKTRANFWVPFLLPLLLLIVVDYIRLIGWFLQIGLMTYMIMQFAGLMAGFWFGALKKFDIKSHWLDLAELKIVRVIPTITLGFKSVNWMFEKNIEEPACPPPSSVSSMDSVSESDSSSPPSS